MIPGPEHRSPDIYLMGKENPGKPQLGDRLIMGLCDQSWPQMGSFPPNEVCRIAQHGRIREGRSEGKMDRIVQGPIKNNVVVGYPLQIFMSEKERGIERN